MKISAISTTLFALGSSLLAAPTSASAAAAGAASCNTECLSYCMYYHSSDACVRTCECDQYASSMSIEQGLLLESAFSSSTSPLTMQHKPTQSSVPAKTELLQSVTNSTESESVATETDVKPTEQNETMTATTPTTGSSTHTQTTNNSGTQQQSSPDTTPQPVNVEEPTIPTDVKPTNATTITPTPTTPATGGNQTSVPTGTDGGDQTQETGGETGDTGKEDGGETDPATDPIVTPVVDPAVEESRQTCIATCTLKCKSESAEKKEACIDLCFNQCTASIALYVQEKERPLLRSKSQMLMSLSQVPIQRPQSYMYWDEEPTESRLRMDEYMQMKIQQSVDDSPLCTASCVAQCGLLAELPRTLATQLVGCFEETCGCRNKMRDSDSESDSIEDSVEVMRQYFDLIHNQERVEYLMLQQSVVDHVIAVEEENAFLADKSDAQVIKKRLSTEEGVRYYEQYLGKATNAERQYTTTFVMTHVALAILITTAIVFLVRKFWSRLNDASDPKARISLDCEQAILKKQRLERGATAKQ